MYMIFIWLHILSQNPITIVYTFLLSFKNKVFMKKLTNFFNTRKKRNTVPESLCCISVPQYPAPLAANMNSFLYIPLETLSVHIRVPIIFSPFGISQ